MALAMAIETFAAANTGPARSGRPFDPHAISDLDPAFVDLYAKFLDDSHSLMTADLALRSGKGEVLPGASHYAQVAMAYSGMLEMT